MHMVLSSRVTNAQHFFKERVAGFNGQILFDEPLSKHTYYRIGGPAAILAFPKSIEDLKILAQGVAETGIPFFILGMGSNLLVADSGIPGLVIRATKLNQEMNLVAAQNTEGGEVLRTGSSVAISSLLRRASQEGWGGLEFLTGIPGSIGGAVRMNAGTHLGETKDRLIAVEAYSFEQLADGATSVPETFKNGALRFEYRKNLFLPQNSLVYAAEWAITKSDPAQVKTTIDQTLSRRKATQPIDYPSCGSVFINPKFSGPNSSSPKSAGLHSWQVIDQLGLRGHRIGNAQFSEKHCNFIVNLGGAKASDVKSLIDLAKSQALSKLGITLEEEVIYLGFNF